MHSRNLTVARNYLSTLRLFQTKFKTLFIFLLFCKNIYKNRTLQSTGSSTFILTEYSLCFCNAHIKLAFKSNCLTQGVEKISPTHVFYSQNWAIFRAKKHEIWRKLSETLGKSFGKLYYKRIMHKINDFNESMLFLKT